MSTPMKPDLSWCPMRTCDRCDALRQDWADGKCVNRSQESRWLSWACVVVAVLYASACLLGLALGAR